MRQQVFPNIFSSIFKLNVNEQKNNNFNKLKYTGKNWVTSGQLDDSIILKM